MTLEDPFFIVKDEVVKAIGKTRGLYQRWSELQDDQAKSSKEEVDWVTSELRNSLRSIEWDLEDLDETVAIVESNPKKFKIEDGEITNRKGFIESAKMDVVNMKERLNQTKNNRSRKLVPHLLNNGCPRYMRLENQLSSPNSPERDAISRAQQINDRDEHVILIHDSLKTVSRQISRELDSEQTIMMDEFAQDRSQSRLGSTVRKLFKILNISNDRVQWMAIASLSAIIFLVMLIFFII